MVNDIKKSKLYEIILKIKELTYEVIKANSDEAIDMLYTKIKLYIYSEELLYKEVEKRVNDYMLFAKDNIKTFILLEKFIKKINKDWNVDALSIITGTMEALLWDIIKEPTESEEYFIDYDFNIASLYLNKSSIFLLDKENDKNKRKEFFENYGKIKKILQKEKFKTISQCQEFFILFAEDSFNIQWDMILEEYCYKVFNKTLLLGCLLNLQGYVKSQINRDKSITLENLPTDILQTLDLANREKEVFSMFIQGIATKEIARRLNVAYNTVDTQLRKVCEKNNLPAGQKKLRNYILQEALK